MKKMSFEIVNLLLIKGALNSYINIEYINNKDYEITNRNISDFS